MARNGITAAKARHSLPSFAVCAAVCGALALAVPSAGLALASDIGAERSGVSLNALSLGMFTPASVDPALAARIAEKARARGVQFTPVSTPPKGGKRVVTVAVRVDDNTARAISVRKALDVVPGRAVGVAGLDTSRFQLGAARGYKSFARTPDLSNTVQKLVLPDLAQFEPSRPKADDKPSRLQPRIELEDRNIAGRSPNTLDAIGSQTVGLGGSFRLLPNMNVTAGVRYSQERERLDPLTNSVQDSQAVYVGTQIKF